MQEIIHLVICVIEFVGDSFEMNMKKLNKVNTKVISKVILPAMTSGGMAKLN